MHSVVIERAEEVRVVVVTGELDAFVAPELSAAFAEVARELEPRVVVDLDRVSFMDSTALGLVVRVARELREAGGQLRVVLPRGSARRIFEITALDKALPLAADRGSALDEVAGR